MSLERFPPSDPREWLNRALSSLRHARSQQEGVYLEDLCFDAQQAAEKALKALILHRNLRNPYIHDLAVLTRMLEQAGERIPSDVFAAISLTEYASDARYPGSADQVTYEEYLAAIALAERVVAWVEQILRTELP